MIYIYLFYTFFKIGLFGFGGGYAMITMIQGEVVSRHHWLSMQEFTDIVAVSQMTPGPIGINSATYVGYTAAGDSISGAIVATFALLLPSFLLMFFLTRLIMKNKENLVIIDMFKGLRPAIVGLLAAAVLLLLNTENFSNPQLHLEHFCISVLLFLSAFIATKRFRISPILVIIACGFIGYIVFGVLKIVD
jgi:chromate transporter